MLCIIEEKWSSELSDLLKINDLVKHQLITVNMKDITNITNISNLLEDYVIDDSLFTEVDDRLLQIADKWNELPDAQKLIMCYYAETQSLRSVGKLLGCSHTTVNKFIKQIKNKLC